MFSNNNLGLFNAIRSNNNCWFLRGGKHGIVTRQRPMFLFLGEMHRFLQKNENERKRAQGISEFVFTFTT